MNLDSLFSAPEDVNPRARIALSGAAGAGKTYTALLLAAGLAPDGPIVVIDSEHGSAAKYRTLAPFRTAHPDSFKRIVGNVGRLGLVDSDPRLYTAGIVAAGKAGAAVIIVDSLTHAWAASKTLVDNVLATQRGGNSFTAWKDVTPLWDGLLDAVMSSPAHVIVTMRAKPQYVIEERDTGGRTKSVPVKLGMAPDVRDGADHAFDIILSLDDEHRATVSKTRCSALDGMVMLKPGAELGRSIAEWLESGATEAPAAQVTRQASDPPKQAPSAPPEYVRTLRLATALPGGVAALDAMARARSGDEASWERYCQSLPPGALAGVADALERRIAAVADKWPQALADLASRHERACANALARLDFDGAALVDLPNEVQVGLVLHLFGHEKASAKDGAS